MNEYDSFENVFLKHQSQKKKTKNVSNSKIIHCIKNFTAHFRGAYLAHGLILLPTFSAFHKRSS